MSASPGLEKAATDSGSDFRNNDTDIEATQQQKNQSDNYEHAQAGTAGQSSPRSVHGAKWVIVVAAILSCTTLFALDNTVVADIQSPIIRQFQSIEKLPWLSVGYLLGSTTTNLFWGQCYTQFDAKWLFIVCVALFEIGSAVCGAAPSMDALIVGRVLCGLGGAGMYAGALTLLSVFTSDQERAAYFGLTGISWGLGTCLGPIVGGGFAESSATWRWSLYINLCVGGACAPVYFFMIPSHDPQKGKSLKERIAELDMVGAVLISGVYLTGLMAISFGGVLYAWDSGQIIALFVIFGVLSIAFSVQQIFCLGVTVERRLFPLEFVKSPFLMNMFWQTATAATTVFIPIYFIPLYFSFVRGDTPLDAGVRLLPYVVPMVVVCIANGYAMSYLGYYTPWYYFAGATTLTGCALLATINVDTSLARIYGCSVLVGLGSGATIQSSFSVVQVKAPALAGAAVGVLTNAQLGGPAFALSIANAVFLNRATSGLRPVLAAESTATIQGIISGEGLERFSQDVQGQVVGIIVRNMRETFYVPMVAGALTMVLSLFLKWEKIF